VVWDPRNESHKEDADHNGALHAPAHEQNHNAKANDTQPEARRVHALGLQAYTHSGSTNHEHSTEMVMNLH
jgi:hypothetical protein